MDSFNILFEDGDALAVGDFIPSRGLEEMAIVNQQDSYVHIYDGYGQEICNFNLTRLKISQFSSDDDVSAGDVDGNGNDEIVILEQ